MKLHIRIERVVMFDGMVAETQGEAVRRALGTELSRLVAGRAGHLLSGGERAIPSLSTRMAESSADATRLGRAIARTVHGAMTGG